MSFIDNFINKRLESTKQEITKAVAGQITTHLDDQIIKAQSPYMTGMSTSPGVKRYQFSQDMVNGGIQRKAKPGSNISFETLRQFSVQHEVSRACINLRKRQITGLDWDIVSSDTEDVKAYDTQIAQVKEFINNLGGRGIGYRKFIDRFIEDLMVLDGVALEKQLTRGSGVNTLIPIDAATIRLRVDESGATPEPPETAYVQVIRGQVTAEFTDDEMIYGIMNPRNDTPYGLAPLESLMIIVTSSLKAGMYNLGYLTDGNIPEGFYSMPEGWQPQQIKDFQEYFDALMSGDESMTRRLKFMPQGKYDPTKKPDDMAFEQFNDWLMKITCSLFEVTPLEIGFNPKTGLGGMGYSQEQGNIAEKKGVLPLAQFIQEIITNVIQQDLGFPFLKFDFPSLAQKDEKAIAEMNEILIRSGQRTVNELRTDDGLDPIDGLDKPFVEGQITFIDEESQNDAKNAKIAAASQLQPSNQDNQNPEEETSNKDEGTQKSSKRNSSDNPERLIGLREQQIEELKTFKRYAVKRIKADKPIRPFVSAVLPLETVEALNKQVAKADNISSIRKSFEEPIQELEMLNVDSALEVRNRVLNVV